MNDSTALARLAVDALCASGVTHVVLCPGSRSAPLAYALTRGGGGNGPGAGRRPVRWPDLHVRHDERVAGFTALGVARGGDTGGDGATGAVVTTSGTAAANLMPAVLEAHHAGVPLVVVTADRPPALRGTWANQTSELQSGLFEGAVRARLDLADADAARDPDAAWAALVDTLRAARGRTPDDRPGPVHLDLGFTDPLVPGDEPDAVVAGRAGTGLRAARPGRPRAERVDGQAFVDRPVDGPGLPADPADSRFDHTTARAADGTGDGTVVVAGDGAGPQARRLAEAGGWPLLAEPSSGARSGPNAVGPYRLLLELPELGGRVRRAVVLGRPTLSRPVTRLLARAEVEVVLVTPYADWPEPGRPVRRIVGCATATGLGAVGRGANRADQHTWLGAWLAAGAAAQTALDAVLDADVDHGREAGRVAGPGGPRPTRLLTGPLVAREVAAALAPGELLVAAASNPVRDLDLAARPFDAPSDVPSDVPSAGPHDRAGTDHVRVVANRGLSGIDGTLSTAIGAALARDPDAGNLGEAAGAAASSQGGATPSGRHVRVLVGDVAFLHDANALLADPARARPDVQVVVLNDDGGGIFSLLEHGELATRGAAQADAFERVFGTPHGADLAALCRGYGVRHVRVEDLAGLRAALARPLDGTSVVEVRATRDGLRDLHARIRADVHAAARAALGPYDALGPHDERSGAPS